MWNMGALKVELWRDGTETCIGGVTLARSSLEAECNSVSSWLLLSAFPYEDSVRQFQLTVPELLC